MSEKTVTDYKKKALAALRACASQGTPEQDVEDCIVMARFSGALWHDIAPILGLTPNDAYMKYRDLAFPPKRWPIPGSQGQESA